jgi:hypothetical protein
MAGALMGGRVVVLTGTQVGRDPRAAAYATATASTGAAVTVVGPVPGGAKRAVVDGIEVVRLRVPPPSPPPGGVRRFPRLRSLRHRLVRSRFRGRRRSARWAALLPEVLPAVLPAALPPVVVVAVGAEMARAARAAGLKLRTTLRVRESGTGPDPGHGLAVGGTVLGIGPANMAGQGWAWSRAVLRELPGVEVEVFAVPHPTLAFPVDVALPADAFARDARWQTEFELHVRSELTHLLIEAGRPVAGTLNGHTFAADAARMRAAGLAVGLVFHGSEIRDPRLHAQRYDWSPFRDPKDPLTARLQRQVDALAPLVAEFDGPTYVSTPDLLDDVPGATWLPVVVDGSVWTPGEEPLRRDRPVVVHAPSHRALKGTELIEPVLARLEADGLITYRRIEGVPAASVPALIRDADVVLDHFGIGNYGVLTCEAMATGRVSISHIHERVRARVPAEIPTLEATPDTLADVLRRVVSERDWARSVAARGPAFVREWHDGRRSAAVLAPFLGHA